MGIDLVSEIKNHPEIVNLLVSLTYCAAALAESTNGVRDMSPSPKQLENGEKILEKNIKNDKITISMAKLLNKIDDKEKIDIDIKEFKKNESHNHKEIDNVNNDNDIPTEKSLLSPSKKKNVKPSRTNDKKLCCCIIN